jgi:hypothetical protein
MRILIVLPLLLLTACLAKSAVSLATMPVKASVGVAKAVLPNQAKADRKRGRELRKAEERAAKERERQEEAVQ